MAKKRERLHRILAEACEFYRRCLKKTAQAQVARDYLASRELGEEVQDAFLIGYAPERSEDMLVWGEKYGFSVEEMAEAGILKLSDDMSRPPYHRFAGRLIFTIKDKLGKIVGFSGRLLKERKKTGKYVNSPETAVFKKSNVLYGIDRAAGNIARSPKREAIVCEGQIDCIRLHASGFPIAVASQGTAFTEKHAEMLARVADSVLLVFDDDSAGHKATIKTATLLLSIEKPLAVRVIALPGGEDPDSFLRKNGPEAFKALMESAESIVSFQSRIERAKESNPDSVDAIQRVANAILATIAPCRNAILRDALITDAAKCLGLPKEALVAELGKIKTKPQAPVQKHPDSPSRVSGAPLDAQMDDSDDSSAAEVFSRTKAPPSPAEMALMVFLATYEGDSELKMEMENILSNQKVQPPILEKVSCPFVKDFIAAFLSDSNMSMTALGDTLPVLELEYFDMALSCVPSAVDCEERSPSEKHLDKKKVLRSLLRAIYRQPGFRNADCLAR